MDLLEGSLRVWEKQTPVDHACADALIYDGDGRFHIPHREFH
jgi:hypothetical protein